MAILSCPNIKKLTLFGVFKPFIQYSGGFSSKLFPTEVTSFFQKAYYLFPKSILLFGKEVGNCQFFHNLTKPVNTVKTVLKHCLNTVLTALRSMENVSCAYQNKDKRCRKNIPLFFKKTSRGIFENIK